MSGPSLGDLSKNRWSGVPNTIPHWSDVTRRHRIWMALKFQGRERSAEEEDGSAASRGSCLVPASRLGLAHVSSKEGHHAEEAAAWCICQRCLAVCVRCRGQRRVCSPAACQASPCSGEAGRWAQVAVGCRSRRQASVTRFPPLLCVFVIVSLIFLP